MLARKKTQSPDAVAASSDATLSHLYFAACSFLLQTRLLHLSHAVGPHRHHASPRLIAPDAPQETLSLSVREPRAFPARISRSGWQTYLQKGERQNAQKQHEVPTISCGAQTSICELGHAHICRHSFKKKSGANVHQMQFMERDDVYILGKCLCAESHASGTLCIVMVLSQNREDPKIDSVAGESCRSSFKLSHEIKLCNFREMEKDSCFLVHRGTVMI